MINEYVWVYSFPLSLHTQTMEICDTCKNPLHASYSLRAGRREGGQSKAYNRNIQLDVS